jgi:hypothetical protein
MSDSIKDVKTEDDVKKKDKKECAGTKCSYGILFLLYLIITSDTFAEVVLNPFPGAVEGRSVTTVGAIISAIILILCHILIMTYL